MLFSSEILFYFVILGYENKFEGLGSEDNPNLRSYTSREISVNYT